MKIRTISFYNTMQNGSLSCLKLFSIFFIFCITSILCFTAKAQDPVFSQFYLSPLQLNPALTGLTEDPRFSANYRNQYPGFNNAYRTYALSYDQFFPRIKGGLGFWILSDDAGDGILKTIKAAGIFSYKTDLSRHISAKMGIEAGVVQSTLNWNQLVFGDQIDDYSGTISPGGIPFPTEETAPEKNKVVYPDLGVGLIIYGGTLYSGISVRHMNRPDPDFLSINSDLSPRIPMRWTFHAGASWPVFTHIFRQTFKMAISPSIIVVRQGPFNQVNGGATLDSDFINLGIHYRISSGHSEALIGSIGFKTNKLKIGYSFDYTVSGFPLSGGTHEIGIVYLLDNGDTESRYNDCLNIFR
ncbi:MAG: PorP/SprF family type IX secretion system membrane protein [Saprospiraceae bacterium]